MAIDNIEKAIKSSGVGSIRNRNFKLYHGFNHSGSGDTVSVNRSLKPMVFITKPLLNLTSDNIRLVRRLQYLTSTDPNSMAAMIRSSLMPELDAGDYEPGVTRSNFVDEKSPFINFLTSTLQSFTGWRDETTDSFVSKEGLAQQVHGHVDDRPIYYGDLDFNSTFNGKDGNPHLVLFTAWREYMTRVSEGSMVPFPEMIAYDEIDYTSRPYVIITKEDKVSIDMIAAAGAMYPSAVSIGSYFNFNNETPFNEEANTIDIPWKAYGVMYNDPAIIDDFNYLGEMFNLDLRDGIRERRMIKLSEYEKTLLIGYGYPRINKDEMLLEWWLDIPTYNREMAAADGDLNV